jgi:hypothetical protein
MENFVTSLRVVFMVLALVCFLLAALGMGWTRGNLVAGGLFFWALASTITGL